MQREGLGPTEVAARPDRLTTQPTAAHRALFADFANTRSILRYRGEFEGAKRQRKNPQIDL